MTKDETPWRRISNKLTDPWMDSDASSVVMLSAEGLELYLIGRIWRFGRGDGSTIATNVRFKRDGSITGHANWNEASWQVNDGKLQFRDSEGAVSCRFDIIEEEPTEKVKLSGRFRDTEIFHVLNELRTISRLGPNNENPRTALLVRTHLVNQKLFDLLDLLNLSKRYDLYVLADETSGKLDVRGYRKLSHSVEACTAAGLYTGQGRILWQCGDYPLYLSKKEIPDYDYYVMIEYDVDFVRKSPLFLEGLISRFQDENGQPYDLIGTDLNEATPSWSWYESASRMFSKVYHVGTFAFIALSNRALDHMLAVRHFEVHKGISPGEIVHCEAFCGSALMAAGFQCTHVNALVENAIEGDSFHPPIFDLKHTQYLLGNYRIDNPRVEMVHPVFDLEMYLQKQYDKMIRKNDLPSFVLEMEQIRVTTNTESNLIEKYKQAAAKSSVA